jgi:nitronate monooxygenase
MTRAISGRPARCLANRLTHLAAAVPDAAVPSYPLPYDVARALIAAARAAHEPGYGAQWAGQGAPMIRKGTTAELMNVLISELFSENGTVVSSHEESPP